VTTVPAPDDDLSYDDVRYDEVPSALPGQLITGLAVLLIALLGVPEVWGALSDGRFGPAVVFYPVLLVAFAHLGLRGRRG
jgi:hypothetical protein